MRQSRTPLLLALLSVLPLVPAAGQDWNVQLVDDAGNTGYDSEIVVLSDGTPYIA